MIYARNRILIIKPRSSDQSLLRGLNFFMSIERKGRPFFVKLQ